MNMEIIKHKEYCFPLVIVCVFCGNTSLRFHASPEKQIYLKWDLDTDFFI